MVLTKKLIVAIVAVVIVLTAAGVAVGLNWDSITGGGSSAGGVGLTVDPNAVDWEGELPDEDVPLSDRPEPEEGEVSGEDLEGMISIPGYSALDFVAGQTTQSVSFVNPEENDCYFIISILLPDGTNIYTSQLIPPGKGLYEIELDTPLETGEYEGAQLQYRCIDMEDTSIEYNGANMALTLRVS